jgi:hypothetical protein
LNQTKTPKNAIKCKYHIYKNAGKYGATEYVSQFMEIGFCNHGDQRSRRSDHGEQRDHGDQRSRRSEIIIYWSIKLSPKPILEKTEISEIGTTIRN